MKRSWFAFLLSVALLFTACGGSSPAPENINGTWLAQLALPDGAVMYSFSSTFTQAAGSNVTVSKLSFSPVPACFSTPTGQSATFTVTGNGGGFETGPFTMTISTAFGSGVENVLTLTGGRTDSGWISGTWTLVGVAGCSGEGIYVIKLAPIV